MSIGTARIAHLRRATRIPRSPPHVHAHRPPAAHRAAAGLGTDMAEAFTLMRAQARRTNQQLADLSQAVVDGTTRISPA
ncbi:ANTAR domain-containing protein [Catenuloplanes japonicus]|uniref:ANTAR domain-containing protein n=1 Tax=Catenuloplanes japonicus TaxID=33876 RepID=UPI000527E5F7|nr:ANTAR domain-containing protein [Catenuloplanes japonicus]